MNDQIYFTTIAIIYCILNMITIIFSLIIVLTIAFNWKMHFCSVSNLLVLNSSFIFFLYAIGCFIQTPLMISNNNNNINFLFCQLCGFFSLYTAGTQIFTILAQAIFRYFATVLYRKKILLTFRVNTIIIILGWIIPLIISASLLVLPLAYQYEPESRICYPSTKYLLGALIVSIFIFFMPLTIIIGLYGLILWNLTHFDRFQSDANNIIRYKRNIKVFHNILLIVAIMLVCGVPYLLCIIINIISETPWILYSIKTLSISLSIALEALVLFFTNGKIKKKLYEKIGFNQTQVQGIQSRRTNHINRNQILPVIS
ncbi:unnamed protein product [Adineta steineri]|uniref:G-protein coupled receptors family 1 profile domain-containing protein n=1 Tax=Adineta steineri TaxID=433720 RepID=A0A815DPE9_9BILA|nr:unnamed protein product [Adineta steineri]CAF3587664.1 unnamed protein product [Adineta steineri]